MCQYIIHLLVSLPFSFLNWKVFQSLPLSLLKLSELTKNVISSQIFFSIVSPLVFIPLANSCANDFSPSTGRSLMCGCHYLTLFEILFLGDSYSRWVSWTRRESVCHLLMGKPKDGAVQGLSWNQNASCLESGEELAGIVVGNELVFCCCEANDHKLNGFKLHKFIIF